MTGEASREQERFRLEGAFEVLDALREELEQWLEEAQDESGRDALAKVVARVATLEEDYARRRRKTSPASG